MAIDLEQFHQVFFEESLEGLDIMESALMELDTTNIDPETINTIFRSAHSIKGGSATFGFTSVANFTHVLETLLAQVRAGERNLNTETVNLLLQSVDCIREMLALIKDGSDGKLASADALKKDFEAILANEEHKKINDSAQKVLNVGDTIERACIEKLSTDKNKLEVSSSQSSSDIQMPIWIIEFRPYSTLFLSGNDPMRNIQALCDLGEAEIHCDHKALPKLSELDSESCFLTWTIKLKTPASKIDIEEIFEWIEEDCDLSIEPALKAETCSLEVPLCKWQIEFIPGANILRCGNEPARLFRALAEFGSLTVQAGVQELPDFSAIDVENCYLNWHIQLESNTATENDIREVFEWVDGDSNINIHCQDKLALGEHSLDHCQTPESSALNSQSDTGATHSESQKLQPKNTPIKTPLKKSAAANSSIRVGIDKVDNLINMVGELVITQSMLGELSSQHALERVPKLMEGLSQLEQNTRELQESVMKIRMLPISFAFSRFPRMVRDLGQSLGKLIHLEMHGENTELDKTVMEKIGDPLVHLVRNAIDHGIESPDERTALGKQASGTVKLNAYHQGGNVVIEITDDGRGLDREKIIDKAIEKNLITVPEATAMSDDLVFDLIFQPGFSTAQKLSDVSGRGVGMDVVKRNIQSLNGHIEVVSKLHEGSKITIRLPLTLAILDGQLVRVGGNTYVFPLISIVESMQCNQERINRVAGGCQVFKLREDYVPIIELYKSFSLAPETTVMNESLIVVVESEGEKVGVVVDELLGQQQVVIKSLEQNYQRVDGVSGATILGDGTVALILDISGIIRLSASQIGVNSRSLGSIIDQFSSGIDGSEAQFRSVG